MLLNMSSERVTCSIQITNLSLFFSNSPTKINSPPLFPCYSVISRLLFAIYSISYTFYLYLAECLQWRSDDFRPLPANNLFGPLAKGLRRLLLPGGPLAGPFNPTGSPRSRDLRGPRYATECLLNCGLVEQVSWPKTYNSTNRMKANGNRADRFDVLELFQVDFSVAI